VNVSSLAALQPFESWAVYCAGVKGRRHGVQETWGGVVTRPTVLW
jgi:hypothetical protein